MQEEVHGTLGSAARRFSRMRRSRSSSRARSRSDTASTSVISDTTHIFGLQALAGGKKVFINVSRNVLLNGCLTLLPRDLVIIELLETVEPDAEVVAACRTLKRSGYSIALDDFVFHEKFATLADYIDNYYTESVGQWVAHDLRLRVYDHLHRLSLTFYDHQQTGPLLSTITNDIVTVQNFASSATLGILVSSSLVQLGDAPRVLPYVALFALFAVAFAGAYWMPEPVPGRDQLEGRRQEQPLVLGVPEVDSAVDAVGFEASGKGGEEAPAVVLNQIQTVTRAGGALGIPGLYVTGDPGAADPDAQEGTLKIRFGLGWAKSHAFYTGQCPVKKYNRGLMMSILHDKAHIADAVNATVVTLDEAPEGYKDFDKGAAKKYVLNPNGYISA